MAKLTFFPKWIFTSIFCLMHICVFAQLEDNFSDTNFTQNPAWTGTNNLFIINTNKQLQTNATSAGEAYLSTPSKVLLNTEWTFYIRLAFSPSATNFARTYIVSDKNALNGPLRGYYIQFGEAGNADGIDLYRQDSLTHTKLIDGKAGTISKTNNILRIKVTRNDSGKWTLYTDTLGGNNFHLEGNAFDNTFLSTQYFGVYAKYTATNASKLYFDDFLVKQLFTDTIAPKLISVEVLNNTQLQLTFSEALDTSTATNTANYFVNNNIGNPATASFIGSTNKVLLTFSKAFLGNILYAIDVKNIADQPGNIMPTTSSSFSIKEYLKSDIVINELMPDPSPPIALPDAEYIELYNTTNQPIALRNWTLSDGSTTATFGNDTIQAKSYTLVTAMANANLFTGFGKVITVANLPSLNNSADVFTLRSPDGKIIDKVSYEISWYKDASKSTGGYSLEKIYPLDSCLGNDNWMASNDLRGGTPSTQNSVYSIVADTVAPKLLSLQIADSVTLILTFSESLDSNSIITAAYNLSNGADLQNMYILPGRKMLQLTFNKPFTANQISTLIISGLKDCNGNISSPIQTSFTFYKPDVAERYDLVISEIMANPNAITPLPNTEYVEIYNRSQKVISLKNYYYGDQNTQVLLPDYILLPDSFVVLCPEANVALLLPFSKNILGLKSWPSLNNAGDSLLLRNQQNTLIHFVAYNDNMYADELKKSGGWSLEMIDKNLPCAIAGNYIASKDKNGGTPGKQNSVNGRLSNYSAPEALQIQIIDSQTLIILFDKTVDSFATSDSKHFSINPYMQIAGNASVIAPDFTKVRIKLIQPLAKNTLYAITIQGITNCAGKTSEEKTLYFGLPLLADSFDIVINEILFNPNSGGSDFVELYNRSDKIIDLKDLQVANVNAENQLQNIKTLSNESRLFMPNDYLVFTTDAENIKTNYHIASPEKMLQISSMPALPDDEGSLVLLRKDGLRLDQVIYSEDWHFPLISIKDGVSLEKINPDLPSNVSSSWHSAASTVGYATPTYRNSQYQSLQQAKNTGNFTLDPPVFSPDADGYQDVLNINYKLATPGNMARIEIYDVQGRLTRQIANNQLLSTEGYLTWDGITDSGNKAPIGVYILLISTFKANGDTEVYKLTCTLAGEI
ncbi:MAG: lamin tail domain-containing protein [Bacteroidia bacterium]